MSAASRFGLKLKRSVGSSIAFGGLDLVIGALGRWFNIDNNEAACDRTMRRNATAAIPALPDLCLGLKANQILGHGTLLTLRYRPRCPRRTPGWATRRNTNGLTLGRRYLLSLVDLFGKSSIDCTDEGENITRAKHIAQL